MNVKDTARESSSADRRLHNEPACYIKEANRWVALRKALGMSGAQVRTRRR